MPKICDFETCRKQASYGEFYGKPLRCKEHKEKYNLVSRMCQHNNCKTISIFNFEKELKPKFCSNHKELGMTNVKDKTCQYSGCKTIPNFNFKGEINPKFCSNHKELGMVNVKDKKCQHQDCKIQPTFNFMGELKPKFCSNHKEIGMVNVKDKKCEHQDCKIQPTFNFMGELKPKFCSNHKEIGMVNVKDKTCQHLGCKTIPTFNFEGELKPKFCSNHKECGMINVKSKTCEHQDCKIQPTFNFMGETHGKFCSNHKECGMINIKINCKANLCLGTSGNPKYKGYCCNCYQHLFPNDPLSLQMRSKTKELTVRQFININFEGFQHDKPLFTGNCDCTNRRRIDHRVLIGNTLLCIETDENQHKNYDKKDEEIRYDDLFMIHSGKFVFIRFNPDKYKNKDNKSVNPMLYTRLPILKEEIEKQIKRIHNEENTELLEIIKLYYDLNN
jgi:hypothetical protein